MRRKRQEETCGEEVLLFYLLNCLFFFWSCCTHMHFNGSLTSLSHLLTSTPYTRTQPHTQTPRPKPSFPLVSVLLLFSFFPSFFPFYASFSTSLHHVFESFVRPCTDWCCRNVISLISPLLSPLPLPLSLYLPLSLSPFLLCLPLTDVLHLVRTRPKNTTLPPTLPPSLSPIPPLCV